MASICQHSIIKRSRSCVVQISSVQVSHSSSSKDDSSRSLEGIFKRFVECLPPGDESVQIGFASHLQSAASHGMGQAQWPATRHPSAHGVAATLARVAGSVKDLKFGPFLLIRGARFPRSIGKGQACSLLKSLWSAVWAMRRVDMPRRGLGMRSILVRPGVQYRRNRTASL